MLYVDVLIRDCTKIIRHKEFTSQIKTFKNKLNRFYFKEQVRNMSKLKKCNRKWRGKLHNTNNNKCVNV